MPNRFRWGLLALLSLNFHGAPAFATDLDGEDWQTAYIAFEQDLQSDGWAVSASIRQFGSRFGTVGMSVFLCVDDANTEVWYGGDAAIGAVLPFPVTPYAGVGITAAATDDPTNRDAEIVALEAFAEWGAMLRIPTGRKYSPWAFLLRRNYVGHNGIQRGDKTETVALGLSLNF
ncbi:MAG: hypothetical protein OEY97_09400 [Nitrospirota bacterium]|nr:hypothetical protein [Nitrospirota bacterium]